MDDLLDSRQLRAFLALARTGSFTAAARQLHLTQSAISHAIRVLEETLDCRLVHRSARQVVLSTHGRELLPHAESIEERMKQARTALRSLNGSPRGALRIGCPTAASQFILPGVLREFQRSWPLFEIKVLPGESPAVPGKSPPYRGPASIASPCSLLVSPRSPRQFAGNRPLATETIYPRSCRGIARLRP